MLQNTLQHLLRNKRQRAKTRILTLTWGGSENIENMFVSADVEERILESHAAEVMSTVQGVEYV